MAKQTALAKKPATPEKWIQEGEKRPAPPSAVDDPIVRVTFEFPQSLHHWMKIQAATERITLKEVMLSFARQWKDGIIKPQK
jgi:hypothetical protein